MIRSQANRSRFYRFLDNPLAYELSQHILAPGAVLFLKKEFKLLFKRSKGFVLDVGCGPALTTYLPEGTILGVDINLEYVQKYAKQHNQKGVVGCAGRLPFHDNIFDESRCFGLLHHLPEQIAVLTVREMIRCTHPGGHVIIVDNVWPRNPLLRPLAWLNRCFDRGKWVRQEQELCKIVKQAYSHNWRSRRFTYSFLGHEAIALTIEKKA